MLHQSFARRLFEFTQRLLLWGDGGGDGRPAVAAAAPATTTVVYLPIYSCVYSFHGPLK